MSNKRVRKPNALKHGAFSGIELLPWEDGEEYEELHRGLKEEFNPHGPLQEDCVNTILSCMWRKRRVREKRNLDTAAALDRVENRVLWGDPPPLFDTKIERNFHSIYNSLDNSRSAPNNSRSEPNNSRSEPRTKALEDYDQLLSFSSSLYQDLSKTLLNFSLAMLPREFSLHLREKVPSENFESIRQWVVALKNEVDSVLLPMVRQRRPDSDPDAHVATAAAFLTGDRVLEDLDIEERLDAAIDRAMKRLYQLKIGRQLDRSALPALIGQKATMQLAGPDTVVNKVEK